MFNFADIQSKIDSLKRFNTEAEVIAIVKDNAGRLTELQEEQLAAGIGKDGRPRVDEYRPLTVMIKRQRGTGLGAVTDRVTFFMTGGLYRSLQTKVKGPTYETVSNLATFAKMIDRIGADNYGLSPDQRLEFATSVLVPQFGKKLLEKTGVKL